jgi:divalent metal cation (Fe/Co/Zn/Cd) transporter
VAEGHRIADVVEQKLKQSGGFADVVVHVEPPEP